MSFEWQNSPSCVQVSKDESPVPHLRKRAPKNHCVLVRRPSYDTSLISNEICCASTVEKVSLQGRSEGFDSVCAAEQL